MKRLAIFLYVLSLAASVQAAELSGVVVPETMTVTETELNLNGAGVRDKWFMDIYVGALYLLEPMSDAEAIIAANEPMALKLYIVSGMVTGDKMKDATREGFENATSGNTVPIQTEIDQFNAVFDEELLKGDVFDIAYLPGTGLVISKNGKEKGIVDGGLGFKQAVFGIWLSDKPAHSKLKLQMLGR